MSAIRGHPAPHGRAHGAPKAAAPPTPGGESPAQGDPWADRGREHGGMAPEELLDAAGASARGARDLR
jgi:hypothetical protein